MVAFKYLSNFWITIEIPLVNCETKISSSQVLKGQLTTIYINQKK